MRAGAFADTRVIRLLNRRFVPYYFNTGGPGQGKSPVAKDFVRGKTPNQSAFLAAFTPDGKYLDSAGIYADKQDVFDWLLGLLKKHPEFAATVPAEDEAVARARADGATTAQRLAGATVLEELGRDAEARPLYEAALAGETERLDAARALARIARHAGDAEAQRTALAALTRCGEAAAADRAVEEGRFALGRKDYEAARRLLQRAAQTHENHPRAAEAHFYAGLACWFLDDKPWANFHWCWIIEKRPEDRLMRRAWVAAADEAMSYPNTELGRPELRRGGRRGVSIPMIERAVAASMESYRALQGAFAEGRFDAAPATDVEEDATATPAQLAGRLRDGNAFVPQNNRVIDQLEKHGERAVAALVAVVRKPGFRGRGYAAWAIARVMKAMGRTTPEGMRAVDEATRSPEGYIRALSSSGRRLLTDAGLWRPSLPKSALLLVARLRDDAPDVQLEAAIEGLRKAAIPALVAALEDAAFPGRERAIGTLRKILGESTEGHVAARRALERAKKR